MLNIFRWLFDAKKNYCHIESEANEIAAELLMPKDLIERYIKYNPNSTIENISDSFYVSTAAMSVRLKKLKYINDDYVWVLRIIKNI